MTDPTNDDELLTAINGLRRDIAQLPAALTAAIKGLPPVSAEAPVVAPKPDPAPAAPAPVTATVTTTTPVLDRTGVGAGVLGLVLSGVLSVLGVTGPVTGEGATTTGQLLPMLSAGAAALGATGMFGTWGTAISTVLSALTAPKAQPKS